MATLSEELRSRVLVKGKIPRGALSRIAEYMGVAPGTVRNWIDRTNTPGALGAPMIRKFLRSDVDLAARKPGPKRKSVVASF